MCSHETRRPYAYASGCASYTEFLLAPSQHCNRDDRTRAPMHSAHAALFKFTPNNDMDLLPVLSTYGKLPSHLLPPPQSDTGSPLNDGMFLVRLADLRRSVGMRYTFSYSMPLLAAGMRPNSALG